MVQTNAVGEVKEIVIEAQVTRANGKVEPVKVFGYWHKNPLVRLKFWALQKLKGRA